jgi:hypothetical protein
MKPRPRAAAAPTPAPSTNDAWILASLLARGATPLTELVVRADMLNHLIPSVAEVRSGLRYLHARGLIVIRRRTIVLTKLGRAVQANGFARRGGGFAVVENMEKALRSPRFGQAPRSDG